MAFDLKVFNQYTYAAMTEVVAQETAKFNEASRGSLILRPAANQGDFSLEASFAAISGLVRRRNAYDQANTAITPALLTQLENASVKVAAGTPPIDFEPQQYTWIQQNPQQAAVIIGEQLAKAMIQDMLNTAIRGVGAAINQITALKHTIAANADFGALNTASSKFGDRALNLRAWVGHSKVMHDLWGNALTNANQLFQFGTVAIMSDAFGRVFVITDSPQLVVTGTPDTYRTIGLVEGAVMVEQNNDFYATIQEKTGANNIKRTYQSEWTYNLGLKGFTWDKANGGASPTDTALGTGTNWDKTATDNKDTAGVMLVSQ